MKSMCLPLLVAVWATAVFSQAGAAQWPPEHLRDTGLYADWPSKTIHPDNLPFSPQYPLWTDGAQKARWLFIPNGAAIDASDPNGWKFPVGTRVWKEFRFARRAETRFIEHTADGWRYAAYEWNADESDARLAPEHGVRDSVEISDGVRHAIPSRIDCRACHEGGPSRLLGVSALQLSPIRDPNALHREAMPPGAVDLRALVDRGLLRGLPRSLLDAPPRIEGSDTARGALGYLHGNCSSCHSSVGELASLEFSLEYPVGDRAAANVPALATSIGRRSIFRMPGWSDPGDRLQPGDPDRSVILARMASRHPIVQMPPLGTRLVDEEAVRLVRQWIAEELDPMGTHNGGSIR